MDVESAHYDNCGIFGLEENLSAKIVLIPVPVDATASYGRGTADAPAALLRASTQLDLFEADSALPAMAYKHGIRMQHARIVSEGIQFGKDYETLAQDNLNCRTHVDNMRNAGTHATFTLQEIDAFGARVDQYVHDQCEAAGAHAEVLGVVGGDHSVCFAHIQRTVNDYPEVGILHIDAHADLRPRYEGLKHAHASIMHRALHETALKTLVSVGLRDFAQTEYECIQQDPRIIAYTAADLAHAQFQGESFSHQCERIVASLPQEIYVSFDIDGLDSAFCPNTGTPVPGGLSFAQAAYLLRCIITNNKRVVAFDLVETGPERIDAIVAARILYRLCTIAAAGLS